MNNHVISYKDNKERKVFNIDFDGTLTKPGDYSSDPVPDNLMIEKLRRVYFSGHIIIIWTARQWSFASGLVSWLIKHDVPFHGIYMAKGGSNHYVDDKNMSIAMFKKIETI